MLKLNRVEFCEERDAISEFITICDQAARAGGDVLQDWVGRFQVREKGPADLVTEADLASQEVIRKVIGGAFPDHAFVGEEGQWDRATDAPFRWIVDPLDGTTNYVHGLPQYSVSVAVEGKGVVHAGAVYDPVADESYTAARGKGAWLNGETLTSSNVETLDRALLAMSLPAGVKPNSPEISDFLRLVSSCQAMRRMGSSALNLCYLAAGRIDGYWATSVKAWDVAAGTLLVTEAGGVITGRDGAPFDVWHPHFIAAATPRLHQNLFEQLGDYDGGLES